MLYLDMTTFRVNLTVLQSIAYRTKHSTCQHISREGLLFRCFLPCTAWRPFSNGKSNRLGQSNSAEPGAYLTVLGENYLRDEMTNVTESLLKKVYRKLHLENQHPLGMIKQKIEHHMHANYRSRHGGCIFAAIDNLSPVVTTEQNFDSLLVPRDHVSRLKNDNYYINGQYMLRAHTSAHQRDMIKSGWDAFLVTGDVYRRDEIDRSHYPVFHQMEGVRLFGQNELFSYHETEGYRVIEENGKRTDDKQELHTIEATKLAEFHLKNTLQKLFEDLFGENTEMRWVDAYFPFTHPSWELEVKYEGEWMEMLGCGIMEQGILVKGGAPDKIGWAFGLGLERIAMKLFDIPDIRLFWSEDERFLNQFKCGPDVKFKPFSKYPPTYKDVSFWTNDAFTPNDLFEVIRSVAGDYVEEMQLVDSFVHPKTSRTSLCYRITYRAMDKTFTDEEINIIQNRVRDAICKELHVEIR